MLNGKTVNLTYTSSDIVFRPSSIFEKFDLCGKRELMKILITIICSLIHSSVLAHHTPEYSTHWSGNRTNSNDEIIFIGSNQDYNTVDLEGINLVGANLSGSGFAIYSYPSDISNLDFSHANLEESNFMSFHFGFGIDSCNFSYANLSNANLSVSEIKSSTFNNTLFSENEFSGDLVNIQFYYCSFDEFIVDANRNDWTDEYNAPIKPDFSGCSFTNTTFLSLDDIELDNCDFTNCTFTSFENAHILRSDFSNADFSNVILGPLRNVASHIIGYQAPILPTGYSINSQTGYIEIFYQLTIGIEGEGSLSVNSDTYSSNPNFSIQVTPQTGWLFAGWSGDLITSQTSSIPFTQTFNFSSNMSITANFSQDTDSDGLSNDYEVNTSGTDPLDADSDDDGLSDSYEFNTSNTNPNNPDSDDDGLNDDYELNTSSTDPNDDDSDSDSYSDKFESDNSDIGFDPNIDSSHIYPKIMNLVSDLRVGSQTFGVSNGNAKIRMFVDESSDLTSTWSNTQHVLELDIPADSGTKFYRFRMD